MKTLVKKLRDFLRQCAGPTAVEYAVLLVLIIFGAMTAIALLGSALDNSVRSTAEAMPSGTDDEDSNSSGQGKNGNNGKKNKKQKNKRSRKSRQRGRRTASTLPANSSSLVRHA